MTEKDVVVDLDEAEVTVLTPLSSRLYQISDMIDDPTVAVSDINRMIARELATVTADITNLSQTTGYRLQFFKEQVKALRELAKTLAESETLSKKDSLNFDGPKFQFVFIEMMSLFGKVLKETGIMEDQINLILRNFKDAMALKEPDLRKQTDKIDSSFVRHN
jgi:hypothetical protein